MARQRQVTETLAALAFPVLGSMGLSVLGLQVVRLLAPAGVFADARGPGTGMAHHGQPRPA